MATYFDNVVYKNENAEVVETGVQRAQAQIKERFPNGFEYPAIDDEFRKLVTAIVSALSTDQTLQVNDNPSQATRQAIAQLRKYLPPKDVTQGHHFNLKYLIEAFNVYNQNWKTWNNNQQSLFWRQVIGYLERFVPVVNAQAFCQGLYYLLEEKQTLARSLSLYDHQLSLNISYFPSISTSTSAGLGFDFGIYIGDAAALKTNPEKRRDI